MAVAQGVPALDEKSLQALERANVYGASIFHTQPPGPDFQRKMRVAIPRDYAGMDQGIRMGLANIERDVVRRPELVPAASERSCGRECLPGATDGSVEIQAITGRRAFFLSNLRPGKCGS